MKLPRFLRSKKTLAVLVVLVVAAAVAVYFSRPRYRPPADPRANGAYTFDDGRLVVILRAVSSRCGASWSCRWGRDLSRRSS